MKKKQIASIAIATILVISLLVSAHIIRAGRHNPQNEESAKFYISMKAELEDNGVTVQNNSVVLRAWEVQFITEFISINEFLAIVKVDNQTTVYYGDIRICDRIGNYLAVDLGIFWFIIEELVYTLCSDDC
jgi:hypothetical protein